MRWAFVRMNLRCTMVPVMVTGWLMAAVFAALGAPVEGELRFAEADGVMVTEDGAALGLAALENRGARVLAFEAEAAENLTFQPERGIVQDEAASSGAYISHVTNAEYVLNVPEAGTYQGWARIYLPHPGAWNHEESMDGGPVRRINDSAAWVFGQWIWSRLGQYQLTAGEQRFRLHHWLGGARLDTLFFTNDLDFAADGLIGLPHFAGEQTQGHVQTTALRPSAVESWGALSYDAELNGGTLMVKASGDGGRTWFDVQADGSLAAVQARGDGSDTLTVRFTFAAAPDGASPLLRSCRASFTPTPTAVVTLENDHYRCRFTRRTGTLAGITHVPTGTHITAEHLQQPLMALAVRLPGEDNVTIIPQEEMHFVGVQERDRAVLLNFTALDGAVEIVLEMTADDSEVMRWQQRVTNNSDIEILRLDFPLIYDAAIGDAADDEAVLPHTGGWRIKNPAADKTWMTTYMGGGSMAWMDLWDETAALMMMIEDERLTTTEIECAPAPGRRGVNLSMRTHTAVLPGTFRERAYRIGVHTGGWHWAADYYREWAYSWMQRPEVPEWLMWSDGWAGAMGELPFAGMKGFMERMVDEGWDYIQYWGHMADGINQCCGNFYWPAPALGGEEGFIQGIRDVQALGGKVTAYMNCQTWTRDSYKNESLRLTPKSALPPEALALIRPLEWFEQNRLRLVDGSAQGYYADTLGWYIMCPASEGFDEHLRWWIVEKYARQYGADGVYIDQAGATRAKPCYNLDHGHDDIGDWGRGVLGTIEYAVREGRLINPDFIVSIEGAADALGQYASPHLISGLCTHPEVYHYTFPDHILISGLSNNSHLTHTQRITRAHINGDRFDARLGNTLMLKALALRQRIKQWLYPARFMDTVGMTISNEAVLGRWNLLDNDDEQAIVLVFENEPRLADVQCTLRLPEGLGAPSSLHLFDSEGNVSAQAPQVTDGVLHLTVPAELMSAAVVGYTIAPSHAVDAWSAVRAGATGADTITLQAVNYSPEDITAQIVLNAASPLQADDAQVSLQIPAHGIASRDITVSGVEQLVIPAPVTLKITWPGGETHSRAQLRPLLSNADFSRDDDKDGRPDYWGAGGTGRDTDYGLEDGGAYLQGEENQFIYLIQRVPLQPNTTYYFAGRIKRSGQTDDISIAVVEHITEASGLRVHRIGDDAQAPADEWQRYETVFTTGNEFAYANVYLYNVRTPHRAWFADIELFPADELRDRRPVLNAALTADSNNDGVPDNWALGGTTGVFPRGIEDGAFWIQGQPDQYQYAIQHIPLKPETTYRLAGEIRRSAPSEQISVGVAQFFGERGLRLFEIGNDADAPANEWQHFEGTFTTLAEFERAAIYLYNRHTDARAWFRNIELVPVE